MNEKNSEKCGCDCKCGCCKSKSSNLLLMFCLFVIILLLSGIFYSVQGAIALCPIMNKSDCHMMKKGKMMPCPLTGKMQADAVK